MIEQRQRQRQRCRAGRRDRSTRLVVALAAVGLAAACAFDDTRLSQLREDGDGVPVLDVDDERPAFDGGPDDLGPDADASDGGLDLVEGDASPDSPSDVPPDAVDQGDDVADLADASDPSVDVIDEPADADLTDVPEVDVRDADAPNDPDVDPDIAPDVPANQPPVLTLPGPVSVEAGLTVAVAGISVADPDVGAGLLEVLVSGKAGQVTLNAIPEGLSFSVGDGTDDELMVFEATLVDTNDALATLGYRSTGAAPDMGGVEVTVDDLGNTGSGGPMTDTGDVEIEVLPRQFDFNVQRGQVVIGSGQTTATVIAGVDYSAPSGPAFVRIVNTRLSGMGRTSGGGTQNPQDFTAHISAATLLGTSIVFQRANTTNDTRISWELVEYTGEPSGPNAMVVRATGLVTYGNSQTLTAPAVGGVVDDADVVVFITSQSFADNETMGYNSGLSTSAWLADSDEPMFQRVESPFVTSSLSYAVVEFTGANWRVQRLEHRYESSAGSEAQTFPQAVLTGQAFLHVQHRTSEDALDELGATAWLAAVNAVRFELQAGANDFDNTRTVAWIIDNSQTGPGAMRVLDVSNTRAAGTDETPEEDVWTETLEGRAVIGLERASIMGECGHSAGTGMALPRGSINVRLSAADTVELIQSDHGQPQAYRFSVVQWPDEL